MSIDAKVDLERVYANLKLSVEEYPRSYSLDNAIVKDVMKDLAVAQQLSRIADELAILNVTLQEGKP